jgi:hypothetical protein
VRWLAERGRSTSAHAESDVSPGSLYASGLIAAGGVLGLLAIVINVLAPGALNVGPTWLGDLSQSNVLAVVMFVLLGASLFPFARKPLAGPAEKK